MLHILGMILKIAGILLGSILGICLLLLLLVLFVPVRYLAKGTYHEKPNVDARISWLFPVLNIRIFYAGEDWKVVTRIFGFKLKKKEDRRESGKPENTEQSAPVQSQTIQQRASEQTETRLQTDSTVPQPNNASNLQQTDSAGTQQKKSIIQKIREIFEKIKCTIQSICDKIKELIRKNEQLQAFVKDEKNREAFRLIKDQLIYLWRHIRPRKLSLTCHFGFDDPSHTGQALAAGAVLYPLYRNKVRLYPDFENKMLEADGYMKGRIRIFPLLLIIIRLWKNKQIKAMVYKFMK
ncbi:MAG: DUF2953 domain-containing protein [Lachnospiraceae bacterium]|nr:DUF2953 domain-containing protein [Lachnospiraceae bacterium]